MATKSSPTWRAPMDDHFYIEVLSGGNTLPTEVRPYTDLGDSLKYGGYHHFCLSVASVEQTVAKLRARGVAIIAEPFICRPSAASSLSSPNPFGSLIELAEVLG